MDTTTTVDNRHVLKVDARTLIDYEPKILLFRLIELTEVTPTGASLAQKIIDSAQKSIDVS